VNDRNACYQRLKFYRLNPAVLRITLFSHLKLGAMDALMHKEVSEIWTDVRADKTVDAVIVTDEGRAFTAGGDPSHQRKPDFATLSH